MMCNRPTTTKHFCSISRVVFLLGLTLFGMVFFRLIPAAEVGWSPTEARMLTQTPDAVPRSTPPSDIQPTDGGVPVVTKVAPLSAGRGSALTLRISGKNFAAGARLAFSNPGIEVLEMRVRKTTELTASIQIASEAAVGDTNIFVVNPDDREAEASFSVTDASPTTQPAATRGPGAPSAKQPTKTTTAPTGASLTGQRFDVYNLGNGIAVFQDPGKSRGILVLTKGNLSYEESGTAIFSAPLKDIQEVDQNSVFGVKTGTLHIILKTGKSYNFIAASLHSTDTQAIVDSLRAALK